MNQPRHIRRAAALALILSLAAVPLASADPLNEPLPPVDESSPEEIHLPYTCDPVEVVCVGPYTHAMVVVVEFASGGNVSVGEGSFGPYYNNDTIPVVICPNTCDVPAGDADVQIKICIVEGGSPACAAETVDTSEVTGCTDEDDSTPCAADGVSVPGVIPACSEQDPDAEFYVCSGTSGSPTLLQMLLGNAWPGLEIQLPLPGWGSTRI